MSAYDTIQEARKLKAWLVEQGENDPELLTNTLEGETDIFALRDWAITRYLDEKAFGNAVKERIDGLGDRKKASETRQEKLRMLLQNIMDVTGEKTYRGPEATISIKAGTPKAMVTDESVIPEQFFKTERYLDKAALNEAFKQDSSIPGVTLSNGSPTLTIRSK